MRLREQTDSLDSKNIPKKLYLPERRRKENAISSPRAFTQMSEKSPPVRPLLAAQGINH